jgi:hypothetical protein
MNKEQLTTLIKEQFATGNISREDLLDIANSGGAASLSTPATASQAETSKTLIHVFYGIGAIIAIAGVGTLIAQNWNEIGFAGRILVTLGISLATYVAGFLLRGPEQRTISQVMFVIAAVLAPIGSYVLLDQAAVDLTWTVQIVMWVVLSIVFGAALLITKRNILVFLVVALVSAAYYALIMKILGTSYDDDLLKWAVMLAGGAYILIAYGYRSILPAADRSEAKEKNAIRGVLYGLGTLAVLGAGISIGGSFDLLFIALIFAAFYGSVYLRSRSMLILASLFLVAHIIKLTSEYFADSIGWPIALIVIGFLVIGVGYMTYYLNKKFISAR